MCSISSSVSCRRTLPGTPATRLPGGMSAFSGTSAPAAMSDPAPTRAPLRIVAPIPTRTSSATVQPWRTAPWPTETPAPTCTGKPESTWTTTPSWRLLRGPIRMASPSALSTAPYQTLASSPRSTSPTRTTPGAVQALSGTTGLFPSRVICNGHLLRLVARGRPGVSPSGPGQYGATVTTQPYGTADVTPRPGKAVRLLALHHGPGFVLPNAWDAGSARILEQVGFPALATTSAGIAWTCGLPDGEALDRDTMLEHVARVVEMVSVPVSADLEAGYGATARDVADTVALALEGGVVGGNLEDARDGELLAVEEAGDRVAAAQVGRRP